MEGRSCSSIEIISRHFREGLKEKTKKLRIADDPAEIRIWFPPNMRLERYGYSSFVGTFVLDGVSLRSEVYGSGIMNTLIFVL